MRTDHAWFSSIDFLPNPARPDVGGIGLGFAVEFATSSFWVVGLVMRATIPEEDTRELDSLSRAILENRHDIINREISSALPKNGSPGAVLRQAAANAEWSFSISSPMEFERPHGKKSSANAQDALNDFALSLYWTKLAVPGSIQKVSNRSTAKGKLRVTTIDPVPVAARTMHNSMAPEWMLPPKIVVWQPVAAV